ncbi:hypothetical protein AB0442_24370 [Kitasatospora sp. NPDC085895]|uniref:hypothetical protein n=1 Tax=Kitasatospora sp. NPDC085895 TaxID=3155057 RepID=UPI00344F0F38
MSQTFAEPPVTPAPTHTPDTSPAAEKPKPAAGGKSASPASHQRGGLPAVPLAITGANTVVGLASAGVLTAGPLAALAAAAGTAATTAIATRTARAAAGRLARRAGRTTNKGHLSLVKPTTGTSTSGGRAAGRTASGGIPKQGRPGTGTTGRPSGQRPGPTPVPKPTGKKPGSPGRNLADKVGAVKAVRKAERAAAPLRAERRERQTAARRQVADARRTAKAAERERKHAAKSPTGKALAKPAAAVRRSLDKARNRARAGSEKRLNAKVGDARAEARKAPVRRAARRELVKSAARHHGRRLLAAALALPVGLVGMLSTPLGRKLGLPWLMHPGRRLYRRMAGKAAQARAERDQQIRADQAEAESAADAAATDTPAPVGDEVPRAPKHHTNTPLDALGGDVTNPYSGFSFDATATEMYEAAMNYEPDGMMHVLATIDSMPDGLTSIANTFRVLAERSDDEYPLDKAVGEALNEVYQLLLNAATAAEEVGKVFRHTHEHDIARHDDPRNGEEKWDIGNNQ